MSGGHMVDRDKIAAKIRALLAKTVENGCTEEEALSAARMAASLLAKYNMSLDESALRTNPFKRETMHQEDDIGERIWKVARAISKLTGARYWRSRPGIAPVEISFFGFVHEVEISKYLLAICARALEDGRQGVLKARALLIASHRRRHAIAFIDGMVDRLAQRIEEMAPPPATGTGLVVVRNALIDEALAAEKIKLENRQGRPSRNLDGPYLEGLLAAERVSLSQGLSENRSPTRRLK